MITVFDEAELLASNEIFSKFSTRKLRQIALASERFEFTQGDEIIRQDYAGECSYLIVAGEVQVSVEIEGTTHDLAKVGSGFVAGDHAMITGGRYRVTVTSATTTQALRIHRDSLLEILDGDKKLMTDMISLLADRKAKAEDVFEIKLD